MANYTSKFGNVTCIIGSQWGDEGKGKLVDILSGEYQLIVRATGGANAGHTIHIPDPADETKTQKFVFHLIPSGILHPDKICVIGNGCAVHLPTLFEEIKKLKQNNISIDERLFISDRCHLTFDYHKMVDGLQEQRKGKRQVGTTKRGIGPTYTDKMSRVGIRLHEILDFEVFTEKFRTRVTQLQDLYGFEYDLDGEIEKYRMIRDEVMPFIKDTAQFVNDSIQAEKSVLLEGANGTLLDIDHGTYPFVTSSNASIGGIITGSGVSATKMNSAIGILKAYTTRVGSGPFPTELENETGEKLRTQGGEFGSTTERPRRCGWFDAVLARYSYMLNGFTSTNLTKLDVLSDFDTLKIATKYLYQGKEITEFPHSADMLENVEVEYIEMPGWNEDISGCRSFDQLPENAKAYVKKIEELTGAPIDFIGVGQRRDEMIQCY